MKNYSQKFKLNLLLGILSSLIALSILLLPFMKFLELKSYDVRFILRGKLLPAPEVILVTIDDQTYVNLNQPFPYPRSFHAHLVNNLKRAGARLIVFDFEFDISQPDDSLFASAIEKAGNVILAAKLVTMQKENYQINSLIQPTPLLAGKCAGIGLVGAKKDGDGFLRKYLLWQKMKTRRQIIPSLALETVSRYLKLTGKIDFIFSDQKFSIGNRRISMIDNNCFLINFCGEAGEFTTIPYESVLDDKDFQLPYHDTDIFEKLLQNNTFKNKIVLIGVSAPELADLYLTPFYNSGYRQPMSGVEIHANAIATLLQGNEIVKPQLIFQILILLFSLIISVILVSTIKPPFCFLSLIGWAIFYGFIALFLFVNYNIWIDVILIFLQIFFIGLFATIHYYQIEIRREKKLMQFVPQHIVEKLNHKPELLTPGGHRKELTMLFCDIRGFTGWSERLEPEELVLMINEYFDEMANIIAMPGHDGCIKDFVGDGILAFFGEPIEDDHAKKAVSAGLKMQTRFAALRQEWQNQGRNVHTDDPNQSIELAIGINTGYVTVGNFGFKSINMMTYSIIGNHVNFASRIVDYARGGQILISQRTKSLVENQFEIREAGKFQIKGKRDPVILYEVLQK